MQDFNLSSVIIAIAFIVSVIVVVFWWTSNKSARKANDFFSDQKYFPENEENAEYAKQLYENETEINKSLPDLHLRVIYLMGRMNDIEKTNRNHQKDSIYETACKSIAYRISKQLQDKSEEILSYYKQEVYWTGKAKMPDRNKTPINTDKGFLASSLELAINEEEKNNLRDKFNQFWENQASWEEVVSVNDNDEVPDFLKMIESVISKLNESIENLSDIFSKDLLKGQSMSPKVETDFRQSIGEMSFLRENLKTLQTLILDNSEQAKPNDISFTRITKIKVLLLVISNCFPKQLRQGIYLDELLALSQI